MKVCLHAGILTAALLGLGVARGQTPPYPSVGSGAPIAASPTNAPDAPAPASQPPAAKGYSSEMSDYLAYPRPAGCCGPIGGHGPINTEMFVRMGASFPLGGPILGRALEPGFMFQTGGRALFFTPQQNLAWTVELGISTQWHDAGRDVPATLRNIQRPILIDQAGTNDPQATDADGIPLFETVAALPLTTSSINQTSVHAAIGHEIYLLGWSDCSDPGPKWRVGYDLGGRWGSGKLIFKETLGNIPLSQEAIENARRVNPNLLFNDLLPGPFPFRHRNDVVGGVFGALHTDIEMPCGSSIIYAGVRAEFSYVSGDFLQPQNNTDLTTINVLFNLGCRF